MTLRPRTSLAAALVAALLAPACSAGPSSNAAAAALAAAAAPPLTRAVAIERGAAAASDAEIAALRAEGPAALDRLLAAYDAAAGPARARLADLVDRVAAQRYATASRLYWYTDLDEAKAAARAAGKPILSLRMLGRLDEDRSCANSRIFRVALYANAALSRYLRDHFVLHWSSERDVPRVEIDFGDGRRIETTIAGNSAHYVLDADGRVIDVIPGVVAAPAFRAVLDEARALHASVAAAPADAHAGLLADHHALVARAIDDRWPWIAMAELQLPDTIAYAEMFTVTKAAIERPVVYQLALGPDGDQISPTDPRWTMIGRALLAGHADAPVLDDASRALIARLAPTDWARPGERLDDDGQAALAAALEQSLLGDTGINLARLRRRTSSYLAGAATAGELPGFDAVNTWVYDELFLTPADDPWLGMATPGVFTGLPGDGVIVSRQGT